MSAQVDESHRPELSVVVLCYHAAELAPVFATQLAAELEEAGIDYELVLVANYLDENDPTPEIVRRYAEQHDRCVVVAQKKEGMMGWDLRSGLRAATGAHLAIIDGDGQMPSSDVVKVFRMLEVGGYDLVKTFRASRHDGLYRSLISYGYNMLFRVLFPGSGMFRDINSKPKVMTRSAYESLTLMSNDWFTDAEIMIEAVQRQLEIGEVSTVFYANERRASFVAPRAILEFLWNLFYYRFVRFRGGTDHVAPPR